MKKRKVLAALLSALMVAAAIPMTVFAQEEPPATHIMWQDEASDEPVAVLAETTTPTTPAPAPWGIIANTRTNFSMKVGESVQAVLDVPVQNGTWKSQNESIATVDANGKITGKRMGQAYITVTSNTGETIRCTASVGFYVGIDISTHNNMRKPVEWDKVKAQGVDFAIIRSSYGWENYPNQVDATFAANVKGAVETGIPFGLYHFSYAQTVEDARKEADYVLRAIRDYIPQYADKMTLPIAFDMETTQMQSLSKQQLTDIAVAFCERIEQAGYRPMVYSITVLFRKMDLNVLRARNYPIWYAYPDNESADFSQRKELKGMGILSDVWQYTFRSKMAGTATEAGNTDVNVVYVRDCNVTTLDTPAITGLQTVKEGSQVELRWNAVPNADRYNIYRYTSNGTGQVIGSTDQLSFTDTTAPTGQYSYSVVAVHNCLGVMQRVLSAQSTRTASVTVTQPAPALRLDTSSVNMVSNVSAYQFLVRGNNDTANLKVESLNPNIATVALQDGNDSRGAKYQVNAKAAGDTQIKVTYKDQTAVMSVKVLPVGGSIMLDTARYTMAPGDRYTIGAYVRDANGNRVDASQLVREGKLKVRDSRTGSIATLQQLPNGNFQVTGKNPGTCYILYEINGVHASVRVDVQKDLSKPYGSAVRNTSYWAQTT